MIEVSKNLYIGDENDCFYEIREDWVVIHACKSPCHQRGVGYRGSLPQTHPEYLISEKGDHLYLNMVDMQQPLSPRYTNPILKRATDFIEKNILSKKILVHCNLGESRAPSIALVYLAKTGFISKDNFDKAVEDFKKVYHLYTPGTGIYSYLKSNWDDIMNL